MASFILLTYSQGVLVRDDNRHDELILMKRIVSLLYKWLSVLIGYLSLRVKSIVLCLRWEIYSSYLCLFRTSISAPGWKSAFPFQSSLLCWC